LEKHFAEKTLKSTKTPKQYKYLYRSGTIPDSQRRNIIR